MADDLPVTAVIINYRTPDLLERAISSLRRFYPGIRLLVIDNGSGDGDSVSVMQKWKERFPDKTELLSNRKNIHHGPAIDQAFHHVESPFLFFLDSDCEVLAPGLVEGMLACMEESPSHYAVGKLTWMDRRGFDLPSESAGAIPYVRPISMLVRREIYLKLPKAERHGAPMLANMREAARCGLKVIGFPIEKYSNHLGRGTASQFGYQLGIKGKINYLLHKLGL